MSKRSDISYIRLRLRFSYPAISDIIFTRDISNINKMDRGNCAINKIQYGFFTKIHAKSCMKLEYFFVVHRISYVF